MFYGDIAVKNFLKLCAVFVCRMWFVCHGDSIRENMNCRCEIGGTGQGALSICCIKIVNMETSICSVDAVAFSPVHNSRVRSCSRHRSVLD